MAMPSRAFSVFIANRRKFLSAVAARDARMDGAFVYAVRSTGIYCRPSCPARRPLPAHVQFFVAPQAAEQAGFRPCRRCHPQTARRSPQSELIRRVCQEIETGREGCAHLMHLSAVIGLSPAHLQRTFREGMGITPRQYADAIRVACLKSHLGKGTNVTGALYEAGYGSASRLYERSDAHLGMTPATYRRGGRGMRISYTICQSAMGRLLVAATNRGISAVSLGEDDACLIAALHKQYPHAEICRDSREHSRWVSAIVRHLAGSNPELNLPTDVVATAFQRSVWEALRSIPLGVTRTYSQLARMLGTPNATRAVARACATNPAAIVVPCHRVVRKNGSLGGYRWGVKRKEQLLNQERRAAKWHARSEKDSHRRGS
ncbi:MAG: bifunctional DNA-binding transcriptional regulator/O6-methylguanine-DNA methyltransferase Ada [Candidatus Acidiferrales bacterium]